jgi:hypothetical protein
VCCADGSVAARLVAPDHDPGHHAATFQVYHHVFAPDGRRLTKGLGGTFPHHRGLFVAWNQVRSGGRQFDFWHGTNGESQRLVGAVDPTTLGLGARAQAIRVDWRAPDGTGVVHEHRGLAAERLDAETIVLTMVVELAAAGSAVELRGDPQHAGQQFRAVQDFAEPKAPAVSYVRPATATGGENDVWSHCAWIAAVLPFAGHPVTVLRLEHAGNPGEAVWSTRPYGRFGAMRTLRLEPGQPVQLRYRYVIGNGARDAGFGEVHARAFARDENQPPSRSSS